MYSISFNYYQEISIIKWIAEFVDRQSNLLEQPLSKCTTRKQNKIKKLKKKVITQIHVKSIDGFNYLEQRRSKQRQVSVTKENDEMKYQTPACLSQNSPTKLKGKS